LAIAIGLPSCAFVPQQSIANPRIACNVVKINDGDTVRLNCGGTIKKVRFCGVDAPEKRQPLGNKSTAFLKEILSDRKVDIIEVNDNDRWGRTIGELWIGDKFVNAEMIKAGLAYEFRRFSGNCPNRQKLRDAEAIAQRNRVGVWDGGNYQKPWDFRRNK